MPELASNERFKRQALRAVGRAFAHHPTAVTITFVDVMEPGEASLDALKGNFRGDPDVRAAIDAILWLHREGYLRGTPLQYGIAHANLTHRAYLILNQADPIQPDRSFGSIITEWMAETASQSARSGATGAAGAAVGGLLQLVMRQFSPG